MIEDMSREEAIAKYGDTKLFGHERMTFGPDSITVKLLEPIKAGPRVEETDTLVFKGPLRVAVMRAMDTSSGNIGKTAALIASWQGIPDAEMNRMRADDFTLCDQATGFFI